MKKTSAFGDIKPLPGQANYGISETEQLERQAREMEARLKALQSKMQESATADDTSSSSGGTRWKGARPEKGSVTNYAKDYQEKLKTKRTVSEKTDKATAEGRREARKQSSAHFSAKGADSWSVADVCEWLASKGLDQHIGSFQQNEISGPILLELSLQDLDYMGITVLAHRKIILNGIEEISGKSAAKPAKGLSASLDVDSRRDVKAQGQPVAAPAKTTLHWSQLDPLSSNKVREAENIINAADAPIDEEAERRAFQEAVMEWRRMGQGSSQSEVADSRPADGGMWSNPFAQSVDDSQVGTTSHSAKAPSSLADGALDEEKERAEFAAAVAAWRTAGAAKSESSNAATGAKESARESVAERLAKEMEIEHNRVAAKLLVDQEAAREKLLEATRDLELVKKQRSSMIVENDRAADEKKAENERVDFDDSFEDDGERLSEASSNAADANDREPLEKSSVQVALVESTLGFDLKAAASEECYVEEVSDDDN